MVLICNLVIFINCYSSTIKLQERERERKLKKQYAVCINIQNVRSHVFACLFVVLNTIYTFIYLLFLTMTIVQQVNNGYKY